MSVRSPKRQSRNSVTNKQALALLRSPQFFGELLSALRRNGLVGEEINALVTYIVATSRLLEKPLCLFIKGPSGIGKNFLADTVFGFLPPSEVHTISSSSTRSWNYLGRRLAHKVAYVKERNEAAGSIHPARLLISEKALIHSVAVRQGGRFVQKDRVTKGPIAAVSTTTQNRVTVDDETRHLSVWLDESPQQTKRIMESALSAVKPLGKKEMAMWHEVQRLLQARSCLIEFPNWFGGLVELVNQDNLWARRQFQAFLQACKTMALIRSFRAGVAGFRAANKITVGFIDLAGAILIFNEAFTKSIDKADDQDLETCRIVRVISDEKNAAAVSAADLADNLNISSGQAYARLRRGCASGVIRRVNRPNKGNLKTYLPAEGRSFLPGPNEVLISLKSAPKKVKFVHPVTGKWLIYRR